METIEVPEVNQLPELSGLGDDPAGFANMVLTSLLAYPSAALKAEYSPKDLMISWIIDPHAEEVFLDELEIAFSPTLSSFQAVLLYIANSYVKCEANGHAEVILAQRERSRICHFYVSNSEATGFWVRVHTE